MFCRVGARVWAVIRSSMKKLMLARMCIILFCVYFEMHSILFRTYQVLRQVDTGEETRPLCLALSLILLISSTYL